MNSSRGILSKGLPKCAFFMLTILFGSCTLKAAEFNREILGVYNNEEERYLMHELMEMVINHFGLKLVFHSSQKAPPKDPSKYRALMFWPIENELHEAKVWMNYMIKSRDVGTRLLFLGDFPGQHDAKSGNYLPEHISFLKELGFIKERFLIKNPINMEVQTYHPDLVNFETNFEHRGNRFPVIYSEKPEHEVSLQVSERSTRRKSDLIVTGPFGGVALREATFRQQRLTGLKEWILNPFLFIQEALNLGDHPIPDISTVNGFRSIYCHIDGDGFEGICRFNPEKLVSEAIFDDVLIDFNFPHTFSLVHAWFDPNVNLLEMDTIEDRVVSKTSKIKVTPTFQKRLSDAAKRIFSAPWVQFGLHGYGHPLYWESGQLAIRVPQRAFSIEDEILTSQKLFTELIGKPAEIFLWTGDCKPGSEVLALTNSANLLNINGGDSLFDQLYDSYSNVAPLYRQVGPHHQIYTSHTNENIYTNNWTGPFYGFRNVIESFTNTESPRRISPVNIYYHWFCGELKASLQALREVFEWADQQALTPIRTTDYAKSVEAFIRTRIEKSDNGWNITKRKGLKTIRFKNTQKTPKVGKEFGVLGYKKERQKIYIHLDDSDQSLIRWSQKPQPHLISANCIVNDWNLDEKGLHLKLWGWRPATVKMGNMPLLKNTTLQDENGTVQIDVKPQGALELTLPTKLIKK
jgi:polysaccharide biosynthesis protein PelA